MALRSCLVSCLDLSGNEHAVEVTADTLYEAVGKALCLLRQDDWVEEIGNGLTEVKVRVRQPAVEHRILVKDFRKWMEARGRTPAECALKLKLAEMVRESRAEMKAPDLILRPPLHVGYAPRELHGRH